MADLKLRNRPISSGDKLPVLIEQALSDVLIVCLRHDSKCFRGVLLDTAKRNIPHGVELPLPPDAAGKVPKSKTTGVTVVRSQPFSGSDRRETELSSLPLRHSYQQDVSKLGGKFTEIAKRRTTWQLKDKTVRNIRLRPRQTLCSKCKNACHDLGMKSGAKLKDAKPQTNSGKKNLNGNPPINHPHSLRSKGKPKTERSELGKRHLIPVKNSFPRVKLQRLDSSVLKRKPKSSAISDENYSDVEVRSDNSEETDKGPPEIEEAPPVLMAPADPPSILLSGPPKVSPVIKISIGEGTILKIPPRLHEVKESEGECEDENTYNDSENTGHLSEIHEEPELNLEMPVLEIEGQRSFTDALKEFQREEITFNDDNSNVKPEVSDKTEHRKRKKAWKKSRNKDKHRALDAGEHSENTQPERHHKHKKKHKHRHSHDNGERKFVPVVTRSPLSSTSFSADKQLYSASGDNISPPDSECDEIEKDRKERPRLLYRWRHKDGLSSLEPKTLSDSDGYGVNGNYKQDKYVGRENGGMDENYGHSQFHENMNVPTKQTWSHFSNNQSSPREVLSTCSSRTTSDGKGQLNYLSDFCGSDFENDSEGFPGTLSVHTGSPESFQDDCDIHHVDVPVDSVENVKPSLMMRIQTRSVPKCETADGRLISVGDVIWGKIQGFPWWPGRVLSISVSQKDNGVIITQLAHVSWFGSSTMSHMQCADLFPFRDDFKLRYNKKKKGPYKMAIKQATVASQNSMNIHKNIDFEEFDL